MRHRTLNVYRAAKVISKSSPSVGKVLHEANLIKNLEHPGIPLIYDIEEDNNSICIIEEYIAGKSLSAYGKQDKTMTVDIICQLLIQLCNILDYIHNNGHKAMIHLDLKPENILIDEKMNLWLIDFDNAMEMEEAKEVCEGTKLFAAPEQYHRLKPDLRADIYSLGMLLLYMVEQKPVQSDVVSKDQQVFYPIIEKCMHHNPMLRYQNMKNVIRDLQKVQAHIQKEKRDSNEHSIVIHVVGARHGIGATHLCLSMAYILKGRGRKVICIDRTYNRNLTWVGMQGKITANGTYCNHEIEILPDYDNGVRLTSRPFSFILVDEGNHSDRDSEKDLIGTYCYDAPITEIDVIVDDGKYGNEKLKRGKKPVSEKTAVFMNHLNGMQFYKYTKQWNQSQLCFHIPCIYEWYNPGCLFEKEIERFLENYVPEQMNLPERNWLEDVRFEIAKKLEKIKGKK